MCCVSVRASTRAGLGSSPRAHALSPGCRRPCPAHQGRLNSVIPISVFLTEYPGTMPKGFNSQVSDQQLKMCLEKNRRQWSSNSCPIHPSRPATAHVVTCSTHLPATQIFFLFYCYFFGHRAATLQFAKSYMPKPAAIPWQPLHAQIPAHARASQ